MSKKKKKVGDYHLSEGNRCSFEKTGKNYQIQSFYRCHTCFSPDERRKLGVCENCRKTCHADHVVEFVGSKNCFCDCPLKCGCLCCDMSKVVEYSRCTFERTGKEHEEQNFYRCITCNLTKENRGSGVCEACRNRCHKYHVVKFVGKKRCYCDCPGKSNCLIYDESRKDSNLMHLRHQKTKSKSASESANLFFGSIFSTLSKYENFVFSPFSIFSVLTMASGGAVGDTLKEMEAVLCHPKRTDIHTEMQILQHVLNCRELSVAQAIFTQARLYEPFKDLCKKSYEALIKKTTFPNPGERQCNEYVSKKTRGMIKNVINNITRDCRLLLVNAIFFKADWYEPFEKEATRYDYKFTTFDPMNERVIRVSMMRKYDEEMRFYKCRKFKSVEMRYRGDNFSMIFVLPRQTGMAGMESVGRAISSNPHEFIENVLGRQRYTGVEKFFVPKFTIETSIELSDHLQRMGMKRAFDFYEDQFSKMAITDYPLKISRVIHKSLIIVDEKGTTAAAATVVECEEEGCCEPEESEEFVLDRPFYCLLIHRKTKIVLFCTTVFEPKL